MHRVVAVPLIAVAAGTGCYNMTAVSLAELNQAPPPRVWVTRADRSTVVVEGPRLLNNQLRGFIDGTYQVMPATDVHQVRIRSLATGRTAALFAAGAAAGTATVLLLSGAGAGDDPCSRASSECVPGEPYNP